jgi:hypothetical protein
MSVRLNTRDARRRASMGVIYPEVDEACALKHCRWAGVVIGETTTHYQ